MKTLRLAALTAAITAALSAGTAHAAPGDIIVTDYSGPAINRVTPAGALSELSSGDPLASPYGVDFGPDGRIYIADGDYVGIHVLAAAGGTAQVLAEDPLLYAEPLDLEFGPDGFLYVAEEDPTLAAVLRVDTKTGQTTRFASGPLFTNPYALVIDPNGTIYVADGDGQVLRVSPSGSASVLTTIPGGPQLGGIERSPDGSRLWVTDDTDARIWEVLVKTGASRVVSDDPDLDGLYNIALEPAGTLVLGDTSDDEILRLDVATGAVTPITSASGPEGITVEPPVCGGRTATIAGTNAGEVITGSRFPDVIASLGGKDTIKGLAGNDIACGGNGKDKLVGGKGKDRLIGGKGADTLLGGKGKDKLKGGAGKDRQKQ